MSLEIWITYLIATTVILVLSGPTFILVVSQAVNHGKKSVIPLVAAVVLWDFTAMTLSLLGLGAIMSTSAALFSFFKMTGAVYMVYLGICMWRKQPQPRTQEDNVVAVPRVSLFRNSYIVTALTLKIIAFFVAFLPQFVDHQAPVFSHFYPQGATFLLLAMLDAALYAIFANQLRETIEKPGVRRWFNRFGGGAFWSEPVLSQSA